VTVPVWRAAVGVAAVIAVRIARRFGEPPPGAGRPRPIPVGTGVRVVAAAAVWAATIVFAGLPLAALVWKAGGGAAWGVGRLATELDRVARLHWPALATGVVAAAVTGAGTAA